MSDLRAAHAKQLLEDELLTEMFAVVVNEAIGDWIRTPIDAVDLRENLYRMVVAVDRVRGKLQSLVNDGKISERAAEAMKRAAR